MENHKSINTLSQDSPFIPPGGDSSPSRSAREKRSRTGEGGAPPLLYLYSNISTENPQTPEMSVTLDGLTSLLSPYHKRSAHTLRMNAERLLKLAPSISYLGFLTLTFKDNVKCPKEAYDRFRSFNSHFLSPSPDFSHWLSVRERQRRGAWHYHLLVLLPHDIKSGFDWQIYDIALRLRRPDYAYRSPENAPFRKFMSQATSTASPVLKRLWRELREACEKYGFGRSEMLPIKSDVEIMAKYVGKYISKELGSRNNDDKGVRLVNSSRGWPKNSVNFQWHTDGAQEWRKKISLFAKINGCEDLYDLTQKLGPRWAWNYQQEILDIEMIIEESGADLDSFTIDKIPSPWLKQFIAKREKVLALQEQKKVRDCPICKRKSNFRFQETSYYCCRCGGEIF